jgi:hypothetical protein
VLITEHDRLEVWRLVCGRSPVTEVLALEHYRHDCQGNPIAVQKEIKQ